MKLPIIILNYNSSADCRKCVGFLQAQRGIELEIVIVDNCSKPEDKSAVAQLCDECGATFLPVSENKGYNAGNNVGLRYAAEKGYQYALIANPDMEFPQPDYLAKMVAQAEEQPDVVVCGTDIVTPEGIHQNPMMRDGDWRSSFGWIRELLFRKKEKKEAYDFIDRYDENHYCAKVSGCCLLVRMGFIKEIGYFDEYPFLYCEEAILSRQVEQAGKRIYYIADLQSVHRHIASAKGNPIPRFRNWRRSRLYFYRRYSGDSLVGVLLASLSMSIYMLLMEIRARLMGYK